MDVDEFTYLGVCKEGSAMKTTQSKGRVHQTKEDLEFHGISRKGKLKLFKTPGLPVLLYRDACETWEMSGGDRAVCVL